jgi:hypothetical protein
MHMSEYTKIPADQIDLTILDRITEADVCMWVAARLSASRSAGLLTPDLELNCNLREYRWQENPYYDLSWTMHGPGRALAMTHATVSSAITHLRSQMADNPAEKAAEKRAEARRALEEAEALEKAAAALC